MEMQLQDWTGRNRLEPPKGGWKIRCDVCRKVLRTKPEDSKTWTITLARLNGWRTKTKGKEKIWRCPEHLK